MSQSIEQIKYERLSQAIVNCKTPASFDKIKRLIEVEPSALQLTNKLGLQPLQETIFCENSDLGLALCNLFLAHGADINHKELTGGTILQLAIQKQEMAFIKVLIAWPHIDLNQKSFYGTTPLMNALKQVKKPELKASDMRYQRSLHIVEQLLRAGASKEKIDENNFSIGEVLLLDSFKNIAPDIQAILSSIEREDLLTNLEQDALDNHTPQAETKSKNVAKKKQIKI